MQEAHGIYSYRFERSTDGTNFTDITTQASNIYTATETTYHLRVTAIDKAGNEYTSSVMPPIAVGFHTSENPAETNIDTGYVIKQDGTNNEFVWVPVPMDGTFGTLYTFNGETANPITPSDTGYREPDILTHTGWGDADEGGIEQLTNVVGITGDNNEEILENWKKQLEEEYADMKASVETYGGFYIGRYETGNLSQNTAVVEKGNTDIGGVYWYKMYKVSKSVAEGTGATSTMIWGCQWDATMKWFLRSTDSKVRGYVTNSSSMGFYGREQYVVKIKETGSSRNFCVNGIYDMAGNVKEWTLECCDDGKRLLRRRFQLSAPERRPLCLTDNRKLWDGSNISNILVGRVTLIL